MAPSQRLLAFLITVNLSWHAKAGSSYVSNGDSQVIQIRQDNSTRTLADDALAHPNATGTWPISGIDVTKPLVHPPTDNYGLGNGWTINIAVATNVSMEDAFNGSVGNPVRITLEGPENGLENANATANVYENYEVCSATWFSNGWTVEQLEKLQQDATGSCNGIISEECIKDLREGLEGMPCNQLAFLGTPKSCQDPFGSRGASSRTVTINVPSGNSSDRSSTTDLFRAWGPYSNTSEAAVRDVYNEAVTNFYPLLLTFNYDDGEASSNFSVFRCIRADNIVEGSRQPDNFGSNRISSAGRTSGTILTAVMGLLFSVSVTLFL